MLNRGFYAQFSRAIGSRAGGVFCKIVKNERRTIRGKSNNWKLLKSYNHERNTNSRPNLNRFLNKVGAGLTVVVNNLPRLPLVTIKIAKSMKSLRKISIRAPGSRKAAINRKSHIA